MSVYEVSTHYHDVGGPQAPFFHQNSRRSASAKQAWFAGAAMRSAKLGRALRQLARPGLGDELADLTESDGTRLWTRADILHVHEIAARLGILHRRRRADRDPHRLTQGSDGVERPRSEPFHTR